MKAYLVGILLMGFSAYCGGIETDWQSLANDEWVTVQLEKVLYERLDSQKFFVHVRLINRTGREIEADLGDRWSIVYPNQWGESANPHRGIVDEMRMTPKGLSPTRTRTLLSAFGSGVLKPIDRSVGADYYVAFNADGKKNVKEVKEKYVLVVMDGSIQLTDGERTRIVSLEQSNEEREVAIATPLEWRLIPGNALIIGS